MRTLFLQSAKSRKNFGRFAKTLSILAAMAFTGHSSAQVFDQAKSYWVFGDGATIQFHPSSSPTTGHLTGTTVGYDQHIATLEGCTSLADPSTGLPKFYTDGTHVWNKNNILMNSGNSILTSGCVPNFEQTFSSTEATAIVPMPGSGGRYYYIFSVDDNYACNYSSMRAWNIATRASYSIVDMTLNGGLGDISTLNHNLMDGGSQLTYITEKITIAKASDGVNYWLILHQAGSASSTSSNTFIVYKITASGICGPTRYSTGAVLDYSDSTGTSGHWGNNVQGYMKMSADCKYLAMASRGCAAAVGQVEFFNFDITTGAISYINSSGYIHSPYGISFDQTGKYLYVGESNMVAHGPSHIPGTLTSPSSPYVDHIFRFTVAPTGITYLDYHTTPGFTSSTGCTCTYQEVGGLQLGPDGNIYYAEIPLGYGTYNGANYQCISALVTNSTGITPIPTVVATSDRIGIINNSSSPSFSLSANGVVFSTMCCNIGLPNIIDADAINPGPCANVTDSTIFTQNDDATGTITNLNNITGQVTWTGKHYVSQNITVQAGAELNMVDIDAVFAPNTGIIVENGGSVTAINSTFETCDPYIWNGFDFLGKSTGKVEECQFINAINGIKLEDSAAVRITNNLFRNNSIGIYALAPGSSTVSYTEAITGNTFIKDINQVYYPDNSSCGSYLTQYYGIFVTYRNFTQQISQNNFVFTGDETTMQFYGIHIQNGGAVMGQNNFTNNYRAIDVHNNTSNVSIENNNFETTFNTGSNTSLGNRYQVVLWGDVATYVNGAILVSDNVFKNNIPGNASANTYAAIYATGINTATITQNQITGFDYSIYFNVDGEGSKCVISGNQIKDGHKVGILAGYCANTTISSNEIDMNASMTSNTQKIGISYRQNNTISGYPEYYNGTANPGDTITANCISNANTSIYLLNVGNAINGPVITNNFLYNYNEAGIDNTPYSGGPGFTLTIGSCSYAAAGANTFQCNHYTAGSIPSDIYNVNFGTTVNEAGNWYGSSNGFTGPKNFQVTSGCGIFVPSSSACGKQVHRNIPLPDAEAFEDMFQSALPVTWDGNNYQLNTDALTRLAAYAAPEREAAVTSLLSLFAATDTAPLFENLYKDVQTLKYDGNGNKWIRFTYQSLKGAWKDGLATLNTIVPADNDESDLLTIEKDLMETNLNKGSQYLLTANEVADFQTIVDHDGVHANLARTQLIRAFHNMDLKFTIDPSTVVLRDSLLGQPGINTTECLDVFPNPSSGQVNVTLDLMGNPNAVLNVSDMTGKVIKTLPLGTASGMVNIPMYDLKQGVYIIDLSEGGKIVKSTKLIINK